MAEIGRPMPKRPLPEVMPPLTVNAMMQCLEGVHGLLARRLYGTGLRIAGATWANVACGR